MSVVGHSMYDQFPATICEELPLKMDPYDVVDVTRLAYPTDLADEEWAEIEELVLGEQKAGRKRNVDNREIVNAVLYMWESGCTWRMLPHDLPAWTTVYYYYRRWSHDGTLHQLRHSLSKLRRQSARERM